MNYLSETEARTLVDKCIEQEKDATPTQELIQDIPALKDFTVRPGKVSDSIFGGTFTYNGQEHENPPLNDSFGRPLRLMVRTERISTHDKTRGSIPFKDQVLAMNHHFMRDLTRHALGTSQFDIQGLADHSVVIAAENLALLPVEMVLRAYMAKSSTSTSLYQAWKRGETTYAGHPMPKDLLVNGPLPYVMDTPSTKSEERDETVSPVQLYGANACTPAQYGQIRNAALFAFGIVSHHLHNKGIILVDTKTEHGVNAQGKIVSADELYTMDSSRFWLRDDYHDQFAQLAKREITELAPRSYSKEFARGMTQGDNGYTDDQRAAIAVRYIMGIQHLTGKRFEPDLRPRDERVITGLHKALDDLL